MARHALVGLLLAGRYRLLELAGDGGMAEVFRAELIGASGFRKTYAIKCITPAFAGDEAFRGLFVEEARVGAALDHPNIVRITEFSEDARVGPFLVMEWVEGITLRGLIDRYPQGLDPHVVAGIGIEMLRALDAAHTRHVRADDGTTKPAPVIHRDVSPSNVLLSTRGLVKLTDFGLARAGDRARWTPVDVVKGKIRYVAPEQLRGRPASVRTDVYSCGAVLWELLVGRRLFEGGSDAGIVRSKLGTASPPLVATLRPNVPPFIAAAVDRAVTPDPDKRFATAAEFALTLRAALRSARARPFTPRLVEYVASVRGEPMPTVAAIDTMESVEQIDSATSRPSSTPSAPAVRIQSRAAVRARVENSQGVPNTLSAAGSRDPRR
jgi:serine/threonine-protein kinase